MKIVFMGTPAFAVPSLKVLLDHGYDVPAVITATDKTGGRGGKQLLESAVKKFAVQQGLRVLQPPKLKAADFVETLRSIGADLQVVVAFRMLPEVVWSMPQLGTLNLHASLLPKYRGAAPINWAIINGENETGLTTFFIHKDIDTGALLFQERLPIGKNETAGELHDRLMAAGAALVLKTVQQIEQGTYTLQQQDESSVSHAPKIYRETCRIEFDQPAQVVHNFIRGLSPFPGAWTTVELAHPKEGVQVLELKIFRTEMVIASHQYEPGLLVRYPDRELRIATSDGFVRVLEVQLQGRRKMTTDDFLNGYAAMLPLKP